MGKDSRTLVVTSYRRDEDSASNDITITLPDAIFSGKVEAVNLKYLALDYSFETIGTSNYTLRVAYPETRTPKVVTLDIDKISSSIAQTDDEIAALIATSINSTLGTTAFQVYFDHIVISNRDVYRDNSDLMGSYIIFTNDGVPFSIDFSDTHSIGPLIGFGNGTYEGEYSYRGGNIPSVFAYESIHISNKSSSPVFREYDQASDVACKLDLYDSNHNRIPNYMDDRDTTVSLPVADGYIKSVREFIELIETELNRYSDWFDGSPTFEVFFDLTEYRFTISNSSNARFGIGFRFNRADGTNNFGSLHSQLGFDKRVYLGYKSITSTRTARILERTYVGEHLFMCSDLIKYNYDTNLIVSESGGNASLYESIFTIPASEIVNGSYVPQSESEHRVRINASMLAKQYNENLSSKKKIKFYIKASSGRHLKLNTQWVMKFEIEYVN